MPLNFKGVKAKSHLSFSKTSTVKPVSMHDLYILAGRKTNTTCYIGAHGEALDNRSFTVPAGKTVRFTQPHGFTMSMRMSWLRNSQPVVDQSGWGTVTYNAGDQCPNYFLTKWHGRHSGYGSQQAWEQDGEDYKGWQRIVEANADLTLAFPRNRWNKLGITLEHMIKSVLKKFPSIATFWGLFCRYDGSSNWSYNAENGWWTLQEADVSGTVRNYYWDPNTNAPVEY